MSTPSLSTLGRAAALAGTATAIAAAMVLPFGATASAATVNFFEGAFNLDGTLSGFAAAPANVDFTAFDTSTGLGRIIVTVSGAGHHSVLTFVDHEIDEQTNTFFNEFGTAVGAPEAGQSWEIDEPGFVFGDIFHNLLNGVLDKHNGVPANAPDDVSMALGWSFDLLASQQARLEFLVSDVAPADGFHLQQTDPDSQASIYFSGTLRIGDQGITEPTSLTMLLLGLAGLSASRRRPRA